MFMSTVYYQVIDTSTFTIEVAFAASNLARSVVKYRNKAAGYPRYFVHIKPL